MFFQVYLLRFQLSAQYVLHNGTFTQCLFCYIHEQEVRSFLFRHYFIYPARPVSTGLFYLFAGLKQPPGHFFPVIHSFISVEQHIVRRRIQQCSALKINEVPGAVVNNEIDIHDLVAAENDVRPGDERKMIGEPLELVDQRILELHCGRHNIHVVFAGQLPHHFLAAGHHPDVAKKTGRIDVP